MALTTHILKTDSDVVKTEGANRISRDEIVVETGHGALLCGTVLSKIGVGAATAAAKAGGNTGNGTISAVTVGDGLKQGVYTVRFTAATTFVVEDPDGYVLGNGATGSAFSDDIGFFITAGGTPFIAGDGFDITAAAGSGKYAPMPLTGANQRPSAVLLQYADTTSADVRAVSLNRHAEVVSQALIWPVGITNTQKNAALAALEARGIVARMGV